MRGRGPLLATPALALLTLLAAARPAAAAPADVLREVGGELYRAILEDEPAFRQRAGLPIDHLPDASAAHENARAAWATGALARLAPLREGDLAREDVLSLVVLRRRLQRLAEAPRFRPLRFLVTPYASPLSQTGPVFAALPLQERAGRERALRLLAEVPVLVDEMRADTEAKAARGIRIPKDEIAIVVPFLSSFKGDVDSSPFGAKAERLAGVPADEAAAFRKDASRLLETRVNPALDRLVAVFADGYRAKAPDAVGLGQYPGGREYYAWLVKGYTTMDVTPEEVHRIGVAEVDRIEKEMDAVRTRVGFTGTRAEFRKFLKTDPRFFPKTPEEVGERLEKAVARVAPKVDAFFGRRPKAPYGVKRLEPQLEPGQTFGYYQMPTAADPKGYYRFNGSNLQDRSLLNAAALIAHELVPGHHFQINLAFENESLPEFRRASLDTAYVEGWGEYASALAGEMGLYEDPYDLYGRLAMEMFLSCRLVVDTGMNALGWPRAKALDFMREHAMESETQIATETLRYSCDIPGQALAYRMGAMRIRDLREKARVALGARFDVRRFHDAVLGSGPLPMDALGKRVDMLIADEKERPERFPVPGGVNLPFSEAVRVGHLLFLSGQVGNLPGTLELAPGGIQGQAERALTNVKEVLERHGSSMSDVVKCTAFLADIKEWGAFNEVYRRFFGSDLPARSAFGAAGIPLGARVEIECVGWVP